MSHHGIAEVAPTAGILPLELQQPSLLRFLTCGSVDDGKSTLIGRLLYDTKRIFDDQLDAVRADSKRHGTNDGQLDLALLVDGLEAEREQGITIDVAYRYFATPRRRFIVADTPGHVQYTRNMATGASSADLAVVLVDARRGILPQTRRHAFIVSLLGIRHVVLAVNKIDLVGHDRDVFVAIDEDFRRFCAGLSFESVTAVPISARDGDNVIAPSEKMPWHEGPTLLGLLETIDIGSGEDGPLRLPVQYVIRQSADFRGFAGTIASGTLAVGDRVVAAKSGQAARVDRLIVHGNAARRAGRGEAVIAVLDEEIELSRGNMLVAPEDRPHVDDQFAARLIWFDEQPAAAGRSYLLRTECDQVGVTITELACRIDVETFAEEQAAALTMNDIGVCHLRTQAPLVFDPYQRSRATGAFILIDRLSNRTVGAGMIDRPLRGGADVHLHALEIGAAERAARMNQRPAILWFTGLSGSGKSTIANALEKRLHLAGRHTFILDGDNLRHGLNRDLGFTTADRAENIRRIAEVARLMAEAGLIVIVSAISPARSERDRVRERLAGFDYAEIFVDTPIEECIRRDPKGLYRRALRGEIQGFTGIDSPYEVPGQPDIHLETAGQSADSLAQQVERWLAEWEYAERKPTG